MPSTFGAPRKRGLRTASRHALLGLLLVLSMGLSHAPSAPELNEERAAMAQGGGTPMTDALSAAMDTAMSRFGPRYGGAYFRDGTLRIRVKNLSPKEAADVPAGAGWVLDGSRYSERELDRFADRAANNAERIGSSLVRMISHEVSSQQVVAGVTAPLTPAQLATLSQDIPAGVLRVEVQPGFQMYTAG